MDKQERILKMIDEFLTRMNSHTPAAHPYDKGYSDALKAVKDAVDSFKEIAS